MGDGAYVKTVLSLCLMCTVLLVAQQGSKDPGESIAPDAAAAEVGRYEVMYVKPRGPVRFPLLLLDTATGRFWLAENYRSRFPLLIPFEYAPSVAKFDKFFQAPTEDISDLDLILMTLEGSRSVMMRAWAADQLGLGRYDPSEVVPALLEGLKDESPRVAQMSAIALGRKKDPRSLRALREALSHDDEIVVEAATEALKNYD